MVVEFVERGKGVRKTILDIILLLAVIGCSERLYGGQTAFGVGGGQWFGARAEGKVGVAQLRGDWLATVAYQFSNDRAVLGGGVARLLPGGKTRPLVSAAANWNTRSRDVWEYLGVGLLWQGGRDWAVRLELARELETGRAGLFLSQMLFL